MHHLKKKIVLVINKLAILESGAQREPRVVKRKGARRSTWHWTDQFDGSTSAASDGPRKIVTHLQTWRHGLKSCVGPLELPTAAMAPPLDARSATELCRRRGQSNTYPYKRQLQRNRLVCHWHGSLSISPETKGRHSPGDARHGRVKLGMHQRWAGRDEVMQACNVSCFAHAVRCSHIWWCFPVPVCPQ